MTDERALIAETCDRLFAEQLDETVFAAAETGIFPQRLWDAITDNGLDRILMPDDRDGSGLGWEDAHVVLLAAGRHAAPVPLAEAIAAGWLLCRAGVEIPDGILSLGTPMVGGGIEVPWGRHAAHAVVADADGARCISLEGAEIMHDRNIGREPRDSVAGVDIPAVADDSVWAAGALTRACQMVGAAAATLDLCVDYANARVQFGRPIGRFQAIQQQLAVMASEVAAAGVAARDACRAVDAGGDIHLAAASAKIRSGEAAGKAANIAHQVHGAIGFTYEYRLSHLTRRLWAWRSEFGAESEWAGWLGAQVIARGADRLWPDLTDRA